MQCKYAKIQRLPTLRYVNEILLNRNIKFCYERKPNKIHYY